MADVLDLTSFCSARSRDVGEPLFATASRVSTWLLLEYPLAWAPEPLLPSTLPPAVKRRLLQYLESLPVARMLFVKQQPRDPRRRSFFLACSEETESRLYRVQLDAYEDLLDVDVEAMAGGDREYERYRVQQPLWLVCTHGVHDKCCAKRGLPIYRALADHVGDLTWQSSHVGGDRFAANVVSLPFGVYYGRVGEDDLPSLLQAQRDRRLYLPNYRGRSCYGFLVQAAEYLLRRETAVDALPGFRWRETVRLSADRWQVSFDEEETGRAHVVEIQRESSTYVDLLTCHSTREEAPPRYQLLSHRLLAEYRP